MDYRLDFWEFVLAQLVPPGRSAEDSGTLDGVGSFLTRRPDLGQEIGEQLRPSCVSLLLSLPHFDSNHQPQLSGNRI